MNKILDRLPYAFERGLFNVAEAYPSTVGGYSANLGISDPQVYRGARASTPFGPGAARVQLVDSTTGANQPFITGLTGGD